MPYNNLRKGRHSQPEQIYFITTVIKHRKQNLFQDFNVARIAIHEMRCLHDSGVLSSNAWVIMPDHIHWLFQLHDKSTLSQAMKQFKARAAHRINRHLNRTGSVWQKAYYDHALRKEEDIKDISRYIVANPL
ncbi:MAG: transposase [Thiotrichaceae bacterium]